MKEFSLKQLHLQKNIFNMHERILIVGNGGREHAIAETIYRQNPDKVLFVAPGNAGTGQIGENVDIKAEDVVEITSWAHEHNTEVIVGPEVPLELGLVDLLHQQGVSSFGPDRKAAYIESSKKFAKEFMRRHYIPTAQFGVFDNLERAQNHIRSIDYPFVIKASGLAAGKGVVIPETKEEANNVLINMLEKGEFGEAGKEVIIEEMLFGKELSVHAFSDGNSIQPMPHSRDHKRIYDGDKGPNTGGMGTFAPVYIDEDTNKFIYWNIMHRTISEMRDEGMPLLGVLYAGLMLTKEGPKVLEFNSRFGDPETQVILSLLDSNLLEIIDSAKHGELNRINIRWKEGAAVCVVAAAEGYPGKYKTGDVIIGLDKVPSDVRVYHAGTIIKDGKVVTNGGRVLGVTAYAENISKAIQKAYWAIGWNGVYFRGMQFRGDIGATAL